MTKIYSSISRSGLPALALVAAGMLVVAPAAFGQVLAFNAFPTGDVTDGRMLALADGFESLSGRNIELSLAVPSGDPDFTFQIFDGDTGKPCRAVDPCVLPSKGHWDDGTAQLAVSMYFDPNFDPINPEPVSSLTLVGQWLGNGVNPTVDPNGRWTGEAEMLDNDFWDLLVTVTPEAVTPNGSGAAYYRVLIEIDATAPGNSASAFKVLSTVPISLLSSDFGFLASLQEVQNDGPIVYPTWDGVTFPGLGSNFWQDAVAAEDTTYDGTWSFFLNVPEGQAALAIFDGDFDHGTRHLTGLPSQLPIPACADDDDPDSPDFPPFVDLPLPPGLMAEGAKAFGIPADDNNLDIFRRSGCVTYTVTDPFGNSYANDNPSSDKEWEQFLIATTGSGLPGDHIVDLPQLPSGLWRIDISGLDMSNLNFWHFDFLACGAPCDPPDPYLIGDTVFLDSNANGVQDAGEPGIPGVKLNRLDAGGGIVDMATTDENGNYFFSVLPGTWTVEVAPVNFIAMPELGAVGDRVWLDLDGDGLEDAGEPGIANVTVRLIDVGTGFAAGTTVTDVNGNYLFDNLEPGVYRTEVLVSTLPPGLTQTGGTNPSATRTITSDEVFLDLDFGYADGVDGILGDFVWRDADNDGVQDAGEPGIHQVKLNLWELGLDGMFGTPDDVFIGSTKTRSDGSYLFSGLAPGTYVVEVDPTAFAVFGPLFGNTVTVGPESEGANVSAARVLPAGSVDLTVDFGYDAPIGLFSVSDVVWFDADSNGLFDGVDMAIPGVTVNLLDNNLKVIATAVSDAAGAFSFTGLRPGTYTIEISDLTRELTGLYGTTQPGLERSLLAFLTDFDLVGVSFGYINGGALEGLETSTGGPLTRTVVNMNDLTYDFGYFPGAIGDRVWLDVDGDGVQDAGEPGINGVTVELVDAGGMVVATQVTTGDGDYLFENVRGGEYTVRVDPTTLPVGLQPTFDFDGVSTPNAAMKDLAPGEAELGIDFGYRDIPCDLSLTMTCEVQAPPPGDLTCTMKIQATTLRYTGPDVLGATVELDPDRGASVFYNGVDLISGVTVLSMAAQNDFSIDATVQGENDLGARMKVWINGVAEEHHTSCSTPYVAGQPAPLNNPKGDPSPTWFVENFRDKSGAFFEVPPPPVPGDLCTISAPETLCSERPTAIGVRFNGGDCAQSSNTQSPDKWSCSGDAGAGPVRIVARDGSDVYLDQSGVAVGDTLDILASAVGRSDLDSEIDYEIYVGGSIVQTINFHTSCSQDLRVGDKFGSLEVVYYENDEQGRVESGADVEFSYLVENIGAVSASNISLDDVPFGPIGTHPLLLPGESVSFSNTVFIDSTVTNTGTATADSLSGVCMATDTTTVEVDGGGGGGPLGSLGDRVWSDDDADGVHDAGESGINGVTVTLTDAGGGVLATTSTSGGGFYSFGGLDAGDYTVSVDPATLPAGAIQTFDLDGTLDHAASVTLNAAENRTDLDFGYSVPGPVCEVSGAGSLRYKSKEVKWRLFNDGAIPATIESIQFTWNTATLEKVELNGAIYEQHHSPPAVVISSGWHPDVNRRTLGPGNDKELKLKFLSDVVQSDSEYTIQVNFQEGCSVTFTPGGGTGSFDCSKPIDSLTMVWDGTQAVRVKAWKGSVGSTLLADIDGIPTGGIPGTASEVIVTGFAGSPNDVIWEVFAAGTSSKLGQSKFHLSCSDSAMDGPEDCGSRQGDGKANESSLINDWLFEGMVDSNETLDCTP